MINHLWQSTLFAVAAGLLTVAFRKNRAQVRYWMWFSASLKFFVPFTLLIGVGSLLETRAPAAKQMATPAVMIAAAQIAQPFPGTISFAPSGPRAADWKPAAMLAVWACGVGAIALIRFRGWLRIRAAVRASTPTDIPATVPIRSSPGLLEPGVVGLLRPILLLPAGIAERLTPRQLDAVLAHELCHVRRRDNVTAAVHMIVEAVFWFHPLVWWIGGKLVEERERACDEAVLALGSEPRDYAAGIVNVCKLYVESPLACVSGVTGADLKKRIEAILAGRVAGELNFAKKAALAVAGMAALAAPIVIGIMNAPAIRAQTPATPKWETVSIRSCESGDPGGRGLPNGKSKQKGPVPDSGRLNQRCQVLVGPYNSPSLIYEAYVVFANGEPRVRIPHITPILGAPAWAFTDRYDINAKAVSDADMQMMMGPMMQTILEDRFKLKVHRETREAPAYALTVAPGGPRLKPSDGCTPIDHNTPLPGQRPAGVKYCNMLLTFSKTGPNILVLADGASLEDFGKILGLALDRPIIDKTGITGKFDFRVEFGVDGATPRFLPGGDQDPRKVPIAHLDGPSAPSLLTVVREQFGLTLEPTTGPREFLVVDHVEKPSEN